MDLSGSPEPQQALPDLEQIAPPPMSVRSAGILDEGRIEEVPESKPGNDVKQGFVEVFVGGLPPSATDESVKKTFETVGEVLNIRLNRRKKTGECKGFGFIRYENQETAERACNEITMACGKAVGVHISRTRNTEAAGPPYTLPANFEADSAITKLLHLIWAYSDRKAAVSAAIRAVASLPAKAKNGRISDRGGEDGVTGSVGELDEEEGQRNPRQDFNLPDPNTFLEGYPRCKHLVETFRAHPNTHNKTPLAILHEYTTRLSLELVYEESADSNLGPFTTEAKLMSVGGSVTYASGEGRGRGKKDAKQVAAASVLEQLLATVPEMDFLQPGKAKALRVNPRAVLSSGARGQAGVRGRGRGRWSPARSGRGADYLGSLSNYSSTPLPPLDALHQSFAPALADGQLNPDEQLRSLSNAANTAKLRQFLAGNANEVDLLTGLRGHSLDTLTSLHRQLANLPPAPVQNMALGAYGSSRSFDNSGFTAGINPETEALLRMRQPQNYGNLAPVAETNFQNLSGTSPHAQLFARASNSYPNNPGQLQFPPY